jgi:preprotein translocase subunit SecY
MLDAFRNMFKIPELRARIFFTLAMIAIMRIGAAITLPGVDPAVIQAWLKEAGRVSDTVGQLLNVFSGGAMQNCAILGLGIMPYISASIMVQLGTAVVPTLSKLAREVGGRQKITQITRYITILLCLVQGYMLAQAIISPDGNYLMAGLGEYVKKTGAVLIPSLAPGAGGSVWGFTLLVITVLTAGTMFAMWLGEQITERGIGNGTSLIISINILSDLPNALISMWNNYVGRTSTNPVEALKLVGYLVFFLIVVMAIIALTVATRKIPVQYAKRIIGRKQVGGQSTHMPLKINYSGVMPIIFASALVGFIPLIATSIWSGSSWANKVWETLNGAGPVNWVIYAVLIFFFAYFWVATMFQPTQISEDMKANGGYIPGIRPGKPTADFLDHTMTRLTFAGAAFLTLVAVVPQMMQYFFKLDPRVSQFFGGTSVLILVGVLLDLMRQVESHLLTKNYDGFLKKGTLKGRYDGAGNVIAGSGTRIVWIYVLLALLLIAAVVKWTLLGRSGS